MLTNNLFFVLCDGGPVVSRVAYFNPATPGASRRCQPGVHTCTQGKTQH